MGALTRWDPFRELQTMRSMFDRFYDGPALRPLRNGDELGEATLGIDVYETDDDFVVRAPVPGLALDDIQINIEDDVLTISGESHSEDTVDEDRYLRRELRYGAFKRSLRLPPTVDSEHAAADFDNGMLRLTLPKRPETKPRSISVKARKAIDA